jgi:hypothetical protein
MLEGEFSHFFRGGKVPFTGSKNSLDKFLHCKRPSLLLGKLSCEPILHVA